MKKGLFKRIALGFVAAVVVALLGAALYVNYYTNSGRPQIAGEITIEGLTETVEVTRDDNGAPHIFAQSDKDLFMAQGFVHAQDRLFQMDMARRQASGQLAELFGEMAVNQDRYFRTMLLRHYAEQSVEVQSAETLRILQWYADGVNAFIDRAVERNDLPVEFYLIGYEPSLWTIEDSLTLVKYKAYDLAGHWEGQAFRAYLLENFSQAQAFELFPSYPEGGPTVIASGLDQADLDFAAIFAGIPTSPEFNGSNNWVVHGALTESGMPMLANDPHLSLNTPAIWYQNHIRSDRFNVNGVSVAGVPGVVLGHNRDIAWGVTNTGPDVQDLFIEQRNPNNSREFLFEDEWVEARAIHQSIAVYGADNIDFDVLVTHNGPIISDIVGFDTGNQALSLRWTAHAPTAELDAILGFNRASNWEEFNEAGRTLVAPTQNFVFACQDGTIAFKTIGLVPIRTHGDDATVPVAGWLAQYQWQGAIPYDDMPTVVDPLEGFIATANNRVAGDDFPYFITDTWAQPYRQARIIDLLAGRDNLTVQDMKDIQNDVKNLEAVEFLADMVAALEGENLTESQRQALNILASWDYFDTVDSVGATLYNVWMRELQAHLFARQISEEMMPLFRGQANFINDQLRRSFAGEQPIWLEQGGGLQAALASSLENMIVRMTDQLGSDLESWNWGSYHQVEFAHPLSQQSPLNWLFNPRGRVASPGSATTVNKADFTDDGLNNHGAGWRFVIDLADRGNSYMIVAPGNSGHPRSPFYRDQIDNWTGGILNRTGMNLPKEGSRLKLVSDTEADTRSRMTFPNIRVAPHLR